MAHPIVHIELSAHDHREAARFYEEIFGWELREFPEMNYTTFMSGKDAPGGGFNPVQEDNPAGTTIVYIEADDLEGTLQKIEARGGKQVTPPIDVPGVGTIVHFNDPTGNRMALLKPVEMPEQ